MHIAASDTTTILTRCAKMTEEGHRLHGMNGNADGPVKKEDQPAPRSAHLPGGRLKFFKDGKFILELERSREGERVSWIPVPRKTVWSPPQGTAPSTPSYRQESSTSLSVSDDNSSIQSSPWQRDHSWKQTTPRRNVSKEYQLYYRRSPLAPRPSPRSLGRRRPHAPPPENPSGARRPRRTVKRHRPSIHAILETLRAKLQPSTPPLVSPRKRFLREMESKAAVEENGQKRSRGKNVKVNGATTEAPRNCSSYSITSILADDRKRSPSSEASQYGGLVQPQFAHDDRWYSDSVDKMRTMELSHPEKRGYPGFHPPYVAPPGGYLYQYPPLSPYYPPGALYGQRFVMPPVYHAPPQLPIRHDPVASCSWNAEPPRDGADKEDNVADMPLNLSKHAG